MVALLLLGRLYLANAGDSRAAYCRHGRAVIASHDFTPETERHRVRQLVGAAGAAGGYTQYIWRGSYWGQTAVLMGLGADSRQLVHINLDRWMGGLWIQVRFVLHLG